MIQHLLVSLSAEGKNHLASFHDLQASHSAKWGYKRINVDRSTAASLPKTALKAKSAKSPPILYGSTVCNHLPIMPTTKWKAWQILLYLSALIFFGFKSLYSHDATPDLYDSQSDAIHVRNGVQAILTQIV